MPIYRSITPLIQRGLLCLLLLATARHGAEAHEQIAYPVSAETDIHGTMYIPMRIDDKIDARFFLDTGSRSFVSDTFVERHGLATHPALDISGRPALWPDGAPVNEARLSLGIRDTPLRFEENVAVLSAATLKSMGVTSDGILGINTLRGVAVHLNMIGRIVTFVPGGNLSPLMLEQLGMKGVKPVSLIPALGERYQLQVAVSGLSSVLMLLDTGSEFTRVPAELARKVTGEWKQGGVIDIATGRYQVYSTRVDRLEVGSASATGQRLLYADVALQATGTPLGRDFLGRFATLIDFPAGRMYLRDLGLGEGPSPFARTVRGLDPMQPRVAVTFPYGGKTTRAGRERIYDPGASAFLSEGPGAEPLTIVRNGPADGLLNQPLVLPVSIDHDALIVQATSGSERLRLVLDTGSIDSRLTGAAATRLQLKQTAVTAGALSTRRATVPSIVLSPTMPEFQTGLCDVVVGDSPGLFSLSSTVVPNTDGALGLNALSGMVLGLDLDRGKLLLWPMASTEAERIQWLTGTTEDEKAPATLPMERIAGDWFTVKLRVDGRPIRLALATSGVRGCRLPAGIAAAWRIPSAEKEPTGRPPQTAAAARQVALAGLPAETVSAETAPESGVGCVPALGIELFVHRRVVIDFPARKILIGRRKVPVAN